MALNFAGVCSICDSEDTSANFELRRESRNAEATWVITSVPTTAELCGRCARWLAGVLCSAAWEQYENAQDGQVHQAPHDQCDYCRSHLEHESFVGSLVPARAGSSSPAERVPPVQHRLCLGCWVWCRSALFDGAEGNDPADRVPPSLPPPPVQIDSIFLGSQDEMTVDAATYSWGLPHSRLSYASLRRTDLAARLVFIQASPSGRAAALVDSVDPAQRHRLVIVARADSISDMAAALRLGAGDFLASPISTDQVGGVGLWGSAPPWRRHPSGFIQLGEGASAFGLPGHLLTVSSPAVSDPAVMAWLLRRILRGYDRVGVSASGEAAGLVFCPQANLRRVVARLREVLDGFVTVNVMARAA